MSIPFAINGLGRIGRALLRIAADRPGLELVAVNDLGSPAQLARLVARDSLHGQFHGTVEAEGGALLLDGRRVLCFAAEESAEIPWEGSGARIVVDATGRATRRAPAEAHLRKGIDRVIVSANAAEMDVTICVGVNEGDFLPSRHRLVSAASCTTNCLAPVVALLHESFGIRRAMLDTVHSYNNDQRLQDFPHRDPRRARAAAVNMIPTTTSAVEAIGRVLPALAERIGGFAVRVPTPNVSLIDLVADLEGAASAEELNDLFREAAGDRLRGILAVCEEPLVSSDFLGDPHSAVVDSALTQVVGGRLCRVVAWYDNEWGHASRLADLLELVGGAGTEDKAR